MQSTELEPSPAMGGTMPMAVSFGGALLIQLWRPRSQMNLKPNI
jgi:hypothetical protein